MIALKPALQRFDWGSTQGIPKLLGFEPDGGPYAEAWWGAHPLAPSQTDGGTLDAVIASDPVATLGAAVASDYGQLPYLLKVLSIARPLSIQVHPSLDQARSGFQAEEAAGIPRDHHTRLFKDASHKPEMLVALTEVTVLSGFRPLDELDSDLVELGADDLRRALAAGGIGGYVAAALDGHHAQALGALDPNSASPSMHLAARASAVYPGDAGALVALAMNAVTLQPGESLYTPARVVHCYIEGLGLEVMANSDNVVRAGLTHKPIDSDLLRRLALMEPCVPSVPAATSDGAITHLSTDAAEFALTLVRSGAATHPAGARIVLAVDAPAVATTAEHQVALAPGHAVFVGDAEGPVTVASDALAVIASVRGAAD